jgi:hypothetical protein
VLTGWLERREREAFAYLIDETGSCGASWGPACCFSPTTIADSSGCAGVPRAGFRFPIRLILKKT